MMGISIFKDEEEMRKEESFDVYAKK